MSGGASSSKWYNRLLSYEYLAAEHLAGLDRYKYSAVDTSPLTKYVLHPFWTRIVPLCPRWLAPNVLTLTGFVALLVQSSLFAAHDFSFYGSCTDERVQCAPSNVANLTQRHAAFQANVRPRHAAQLIGTVCSCIPAWVWLASAVCQFLAHTLDAIDGKQARRTGSSSPLGELFDHGIDSWAALFLPLAIFSIFGRSEAFGLPVARLYALLWVILFSFIVTHWEKYNTGVLFLPWSCDASQVAMTLAFLATYFLGMDVWRHTFGSVNLALFFELFTYASSVLLTVPFTAQNFYSAYKSNKMIQKSTYEMLRPLIPVVYLFAVQLVWVAYSRVDILELEPRVFFWLTGTLFSNITCRLIVAQMTTTRCQIFNWTLIPLTLVVLFFSLPVELVQNKWLAPYLTKEAEIKTLYLMAYAITLCHLHYGYRMVRQIAKHLQIYAFVITSKPPQRQVAKQQ